MLLAHSKYLLCNSTESCRDSDGTSGCWAELSDDMVAPMWKYISSHGCLVSGLPCNHYLRIIKFFKDNAFEVYLMKFLTSFFCFKITEDA